MRQSQLFNENERAADRESLLRAVNNQILASKNIEEEVNAIVTEIGKIYKVDRVGLRFYEAATRSFSEVKENIEKMKLFQQFLAAVHTQKK